MNPARFPASNATGGHFQSKHYGVLVVLKRHSFLFLTSVFGPLMNWTSAVMFSNPCNIQSRDDLGYSKSFFFIIAINMNKAFHRIMAHFLLSDYKVSKATVFPLKLSFTI